MMAKRHVENTVMQFNDNFSDLCKFAFELRKLDLEDKFTYKMLNGNIAHDIIVKLICKNYWSQEEQVMKVHED